MLTNYTEAFDIKYYEYEGDNTIQVAEVLEENEGSVLLSLDANWLDINRNGRVEVSLTVPIVKPVRFKNDGEIFGHIIRLPYSETERFCHPLLVSKTAEKIAEDTFGSLIFDATKDEDYIFEWWSFYDRINYSATVALTKIRKSMQYLTPGLCRFHLRREISNLIAPNDTNYRPPTSWSENNGGNEHIYSGIPITNEALIFRHMYEVKLAYPNVPGNDLLYENLKMKYLAFLDGGK